MRALYLVPFIGLGTACCSHKDVAVAVQEQPAIEVEAPAVTGPPTIVYSTRVDVGDAVPIILSADGKEVVSYPHPSDLRTTSGYPLPTPIGKGYLLDNRGIGLNTVFLRWSYAEYAALDKAPSLDELLGAVEYRDPFVEMYDCGVRNKYADPVKELREIALAGSWPSKCKRLK